MASYTTSCILGLMLRLPSLLPTLGFTRLLRKMYTRFYLGSTHTQVPVKPVCPKVWSDASFDG
jgi:hypothetical protein